LSEAPLDHKEEARQNPRELHGENELTGNRTKASEQAPDFAFHEPCQPIIDLLTTCFQKLQIKNKKSFDQNIRMA
jgi:hypothetical protein